jgi:hypothetical protein
MLLPAAVVFLFGVGLMGELSSSDMFRPRPIRGASNVEEVPEVFREESKNAGALHHWNRTYYFMSNFPAVCEDGNSVNNFQRRQCEAFSAAHQLGMGLSALPFVLMLLFLRVAPGHLDAFYRRARKRVQANKPMSQGVVTQPAKAPADFFSWYYGLRPIGVQLPQGEQLKVYVPRDVPMPEPGQAMLVFEPISSWGKGRHVGKVYLPHVAVVRGARST